MKEHTQRMINELAQLQERITKLDKFLTEQTIVQIVSDENLELMKKQLTHMKGYEEALIGRIDLETKQKA